MLLLLSRSEIRRTLFREPGAVPVLAVVLWGVSFAVLWWRYRERKE